MACGDWRSNRRRAAWGPATASPEQRRNPNVAGGATAPASCAGTLASPTAMQRPARPPPLFRSWVSCLAATARPASHITRTLGYVLAVKLRHATITELAVLQSREGAARPAGTRGVDGGEALLLGRAASRLATATQRRVCASPDQPGRMVFELPSGLE